MVLKLMWKDNVSTTSISKENERIKELVEWMGSKGYNKIVGISQ